MFLQIKAIVTSATCFQTVQQKKKKCVRMRVCLEREREMERGKANTAKYQQFVTVSEAYTDVIVFILSIFP